MKPHCRLPIVLRHYLSPRRRLFKVAIPSLFLAIFWMARQLTLNPPWKDASPGTDSRISFKKGICISAKRFKCHDLHLFNKAGWFYNWSLEPVTAVCPNSSLAITAEFVPMQWGGNMPTAIPYNHKYLLAFNEPNHEMWLVSPSASPCGPKSCCRRLPPPQANFTVWFDEFFAECTSIACGVAYVAVHHYSCNADETMSFLEAVFARYGKRIWLTEFGCPLTSNVSTLAAYMAAIVPRLEQAHFVFRYAWFSARFPGRPFVAKETSLFEQDAGALTSLGHLYFSL